MGIGYLVGKIKLLWRHGEQYAHFCCVSSAIRRTFYCCGVQSMLVAKLAVASMVSASWALGSMIAHQCLESARFRVMGACGLLKTVAIMIRQRGMRLRQIRRFGKRVVKQALDSTFLDFEAFK